MERDFQFKYYFFSVVFLPKVVVFAEEYRMEIMLGRRNKLRSK